MYIAKFVCSLLSICMRGTADDINYLSNYMKLICLNEAIYLVLKYSLPLKFYICQNQTALFNVGFFHN